MSRKEMVKHGGYRWHFLPAQRQPLPLLPSKGQQLPFSLCCCCPPAPRCTCGLALPRRREEKGLKRGSKRLLENTMGATGRVWARAMVLPSTLPSNTRHTRLRVASCPNCPSSGAPLGPRLGKESEVSAEAAARAEPVQAALATAPSGTHSLDGAELTVAPRCYGWGRQPGLQYLITLVILDNNNYC